MKYIVILGDGMADYRRGPLKNATPLDLAKKPHIDDLARRGEVGIVKTIPDGVKPGSDVANLSVLGYSPKKYYTGRSPLEALSIGVPMKDTDVAMRVNLVTLSDDAPFSEKIMVDYSAGEISTAEAAEILKDVQKELGDSRFSFYNGVSYRHCCIDASGKKETEFTPPHDISDRKIGEYLPKGDPAFFEMIQASNAFLRNHPINLARRARGKHEANSIWFWGAGTKPMLSSFLERYGLKGAVVSAVDLIKGIAVGTGMKNYDVEGATGNIDTNFDGKAKAVIQAVDDGYDFVYLHVEAPDECGHRGEAENKILSIEKLDEVAAYIEEELKKRKLDYSIAVLPDHPTPLCTKTHASDPVPFVIYNSKKPGNSGLVYNEEEAKKGIYLDSGVALMSYFINKKISE